MSKARILEPIFLGCAANVIINLMFGQGRYGWDIREFVVACVLAVPVTELNRMIDRRLEQRISWVAQPVRRLLMHFAFITVSLMISLNLLGSGYMLVTGSGFFSFGQLIVINLVVLALAVALTMTKWSLHFYFRWLGAEGKAQASSKRVEELMAKMTPLVSMIEIQKGLSKIRVKVESIYVAKVEMGTVRLYSCDGENGVFQGSLSELAQQLPENLFFRASRDMIVHRNVIRKTTSSSFGKILVTLGQPTENSVVVSRLKAAAFRRWYHSNSA